MKFINTKRFSPVIYERDLPDEEDYFHMRPDQITPEFLASGNYIIDEAWWNRQLDRCLNGYEVKNAIVPGGDFLIDGKDALWYGKDCHIPLYDLVIKDGTVFIPGRHYFYLNFWPIYGVREGFHSKTLTNPKFIALDYFFGIRIMMQILQGLDNQELKGRQEGFSEKGGGMVLGYNYTFIKDSLNLIVAGEQADADHTFDNCNRGLHALSNTQFYKERAKGGDNQELIRARHFGSEIRALTAKDKPQTLSRFSPYWVWYEEVGKGKKGWSLRVNRYVKPSIVTEGKRTGYQTYIGTAGEMDEGVFDLEERHYHPERNNILAFPNKFEESPSDDRVGHFTGKHWYHIIDEDGNPEVQRSIKDIHEEQALMDAETRYKDMTQRAIYASQAFMTSTVGFFGEYILSLLHKRKNYIMTHREAQIVRTGVLKPIDDKNPFKGMTFSDDPNGWIKIVEEPERDPDGNLYINLYKGGEDSYDQDEALTSKSRGAFYIRKRLNHITNSPFHEMYVAQIVERPSVEEGGAELHYQHVAFACIYFGCKVNVEYSNMRIFQYFFDHGYEVLLEERPQLAFAGKILDSQVSNRYGTDRALKPYILAILKDRLNEDFVSRMFFVEQIEAFIKFRYDPSGKKYNCDITIASAEAEVMCKEYEFSLVKAAAKSEKKGYRTFARVGSRLVENYN